jgi:ribosomal protein S18 acetylase RimI-like enzyme
MQIREDPWLADRMGRPVFRIEQAVTDGQPVDIGDLPGAGFYYAKLDVQDVGSARELTKLGLYVVDVSVTFRMQMPVDTGPAKRAEEVQVHDASPSHADDLVRIAGSCFRYSRFHLDPEIPTQLADQIKHDWIRSYVDRQRGECLLEAVIDDRPVGFLAVLSCQDERGRGRAIDLVGVDTAYQGRGVGSRLVAHFVGAYKDEFDYLQVGTQIANKPSLKLYQAAGFSISGAQYVFHAHIN